MRSKPVTHEGDESLFLGGSRPSRPQTADCGITETANGQAQFIL